MPFIKLDTDILTSSLWMDSDVTLLFITALLMAEPYELRIPAPQIGIGTLDETGFVVPPGWYGFAHAAGPGLVHRALLPQARGMKALKILGDPDEDSRSQQFEGRRLVRVDGGFIVLNYIRYREKDHTAAERMKRFRDRQKNEVQIIEKPTRIRKPSLNPNLGVAQSTMTDAEAEAIRKKLARKKGA
jgi:hypothetical protein